jgi:hypothetical protein
LQAKIMEQKYISPLPDQALGARRSAELAAGKERVSK